MVLRKPGSDGAGTRPDSAGSRHAGLFPLPLVPESISGIFPLQATVLKPRLASAIQELGDLEQVLSSQASVSSPAHWS